MAGGVNKVILMGHLGKDPETRFGQGGMAVCNFSLATSESFTDKQGQRQDRTEWHRIVVFGKLAELCGEYLRKGRMAYVEGRLQTRQWEDRDGQKRSTTEIVASQVVFVGGRGDGAGNGGGSSRSGSSDMGAPPADDYGMMNQGGGMMMPDSDVPF